MLSSSSTISMNGGRQHMINTNSPLTEWVTRKYGSCPTVISGPLQNVLNFARKTTPKPKPVMIYIHHDQRVFNWFSSQVLIEFLNENYIVWFWNITDQVNRHKLMEMWNDAFPNENEMNFSKSQCPMIVAVNQSEYFYQLDKIYISDGVPSIIENINIEMLIGRLITFKEQFDQYEKYYKSPFFQQIASRPYLAIMICKYLPLNIIVKALPLDILQELVYRNIEFFVEYPTYEFVTNTVQKIVSKKIVLVRVKANQIKQTFESSQTNPFPYVRTLIIEDFNSRGQLNSSYKMKNCFPTLKCICFCFNQKQSIDIRKFCDIFSLLPPTTKELCIDGKTVCCSHRDSRLLFIIPTSPDVKIEKFRLNLCEISQPTQNQCVNYPNTCILNTLVNFFRIMQNIQDIHIIISKHFIETFMNVTEWIYLVENCQQLKQIKIKIRETIIFDSRIQTKIDEIQNTLRDKRETVKFQMTTPSLSNTD